MSWAVDELAFDELAVDEMAVDDLTLHHFWTITSNLKYYKNLE
jgi:hypothetical protein